MEFEEKNGACMLRMCQQRRLVPYWCLCPLPAGLVCPPPPMSEYNTSDAAFMFQRVVNPLLLPANWQSEAGKAQLFSEFPASFFCEHPTQCNFTAAMDVSVRPARLCATESLEAPFPHGFCCLLCASPPPQVVQEYCIVIDIIRRSRRPQKKNPVTKGFKPLNYGSFTTVCLHSLERCVNSRRNPLPLRLQRPICPWRAAFSTSAMRWRCCTTPSRRTSCLTASTWARRAVTAATPSR